MQNKTDFMQSVIAKKIPFRCLCNLFEENQFRIQKIVFTKNRMRAIFRTEFSAAHFIKVMPVLQYDSMARIPV
jgi:hypothetical protein